MAASRYLPVRGLAAWPIPCVNCPKLGVKQVLVPWAEPGGRFSILFETHVLEVLEACQNTTAACRLRGISSDQAWGLQELLRALWEHATPDEASEFFLNWYRRVIHGKLEPMKNVARMIKSRLAQVVSYCQHRITNAVAEGLNSKIQALKSAARGFRNFDNYRAAILFHCGSLDLLPNT